MIARAHPIDLLFVIAPHSLLLDIAGPAEAFRLANLHRHARGQPPRFRFRALPTFPAPFARGSSGPWVPVQSTPMNCPSFAHF